MTNEKQEALAAADWLYVWLVRQDYLPAKGHEAITKVETIRAALSHTALIEKLRGMKLGAIVGRLFKRFFYGINLERCCGV